MFKKKRNPAFGDRLLRILLIIGLLVSVLTFVLWYTNRNSALLTVDGSVESGDNVTTGDTPDGKTVTTVTIHTSVHTETERTTSTPDPLELVKVYVTGAVNQPGVYTLKSGSCLIDALEVAGGAATNASIQYINLAQLLISHTMIYIPSEAEVAALKENHEISEMLRIIDKWVQPLGFSGHEYTHSIDTARHEKIKVDINHADLRALMTLPGIGEVTAARIIEFRESRGGFRDLNELMLVPGIKEAKFAALLPGITITPR